MTDELDGALQDAHARFAARRPRTWDWQQRAQAVLPGGNTRSVLHTRPFPLRITRAWDAVLEDVDGHTYVDLLGEYSAGLYGHQHPVVVEAAVAALREGISRGAPTEHEVRLAEAVCRRWPSIERVRFTNSGTEANLMAVATARVATGRSRVLAFTGGYHGGLLSFGAGPSPVNAPYDVVLARYNDADGARALVAAHADELACVLVEPMLGSAGCVPGEPGFLHALREETSRHGVLLVFDEVMTSRTGAGGYQGLVGVRPDLTTLGKYLGGGSSIGAFGGRADLMDLYDPSRAGALQHAGTFNNNVVSMAAGLAGLTRVYTPEVAAEHTATGDRLRSRLQQVVEEVGAPVTVTGCGSLMTFHPTRVPPRCAEDVTGTDRRPVELLFLDLVERGYYIAARGYLALSLAVEDAQLDGFVTAVGDALADRARLLAGAARSATAGTPS